MASPIEMIAEYEEEAEARLALSQLDAAGIHAEVHAGESEYPPHAQVYWVIVASDDAQLARQVLSQGATIPEDWETAAEACVEGWICVGCDTEVDRQEMICPQCGTSKEQLRQDEDEDDD